MTEEKGLALKSPEEMSAEELGVEIRQITRQAKMILLDFGIQIGYRLKLAQGKVEHFPEWVEENTEFSKSAAYRYIKLFEEYGGQTGLFGVENSFPTLGMLSISNALRLLAVPAEEREEFAKNVDAENISARELQKAIEEKNAAEKAIEQMTETLKQVQSEKKHAEEDRKTITAERDALRREYRKLKARPVEVAVQEPTEEQIREAAEGMAKEAIESAEKAKAAAEEKEKAAAEEVSRMQAQLREAEAKLSDAGNSEELKKMVRSVTEELKKAKLRQQIATANTLFQQAQKIFADAMSAVESIEDEETRRKVRAAMVAGIEKVKESA